MNNEKILDRLKIVFNVRADNELGSILGIKPTTYSTWKNGGTQPNYEILFRKVEHLGMNLHWLLTGEGEMMLKDAQGGGGSGSGSRYEQIGKLAEELVKKIIEG